MNTCYKEGGCGVYENRSCNECPASKREYLYRNQEEQMKKMYVPFGDWSNDGHGMYEKVLIEIKDTAALGKSVKYMKEKYGEGIFREIANDYGCSGISEDVFQILEENNYDFTSLKETEDLPNMSGDNEFWRNLMKGRVESDKTEESENNFTLATIQAIYFFLLRLGGADFRICSEYEKIPLFTDETVGYGCFYD